MIRGRNQQAYDAFKARAEVPMLVAAGVLALILVVPLFVDVPDGLFMPMEWLLWVIWAMFLVEYLVLLFLAPDRWQMFKTHIPDLILVVVPFLRPLRLLRVVGSLASFSRSGGALSRITGRSGLRWYAGICLLVILAGGLLFYAVEHSAPEVDNFADGIWWAVVTVTTVGYGDHAPVTAEGRIVASLLMLVGISIISVVTASVATYLVQTEDEGLDAVNARLSELDAVVRGGSVTYASLSESSKARVDELVERLAAEEAES